MLNDIIRNSSVKLKRYDLNLSKFSKVARSEIVVEPYNSRTLESIKSSLVGELIYKMIEDGSLVFEKRIDREKEIYSLEVVILDKERVYSHFYPHDAL